MPLITPEIIKEAKDLIAKTGEGPDFKDLDDLIALLQAFIVDYESNNPSA